MSYCPECDSKNVNEKENQRTDTGILKVISWKSVSVGSTVFFFCFSPIDNNFWMG